MDVLFHQLISLFAFFNYLETLGSLRNRVKVYRLFRIHGYAYIPFGTSSTVPAVHSAGFLMRTCTLVKIGKMRRALCDSPCGENMKSCRLFFWQATFKATSSNLGELKQASNQVYGRTNDCECFHNAGVPLRIIICPVCLQFLRTGRARQL